MEADNVMDAPIEAQLSRAQLSPYVRKTARQANEDHPNFSEAQFAEARCKVARTAEVPVESALKVFFDKGRMAEGQVRALRALKAAGYFKAKLNKLDVEQHFVTLYNRATDFVGHMEELSKQLEALPGDHPKRAVLMEVLEGFQTIKVAFDAVLAETAKVDFEHIREVAWSNAGEGE
jgi:hypothetical protein